MGRNAPLGRGSGQHKEPRWGLGGRGLLESVAALSAYTVFPVIPSLEESVLDQQGGPLRS